MTKYKTQQAQVVHDYFLKPATERAQTIFDADRSIRNADRLTKGSIQVGHILANLFEALLARTQTSEWKEDGIILEAKELQQNEYSKLRQTMKKKSNEEREVEILQAVLEKEINASKQTRCQIELNIVRYLKQALDSFLLALQVAGTCDDDMSAHVFRMVSLWFSSHSDVSAVENNVNEEMAQGLGRVPSFRFVPLTNQLFSRIETVQDGKEKKFQLVLQKIVFRMCNDHPYHCLPPLMALSNGGVVGDTSGSLGASLLVENAEEGSKVTAANEILSKLKKNGLPYVADLTESYDALITAYNNVAYASIDHLTSKKKTKRIKFSELLKSSALSSLDRCLKGYIRLPCVLTSSPDLRPGKDYGNGNDTPIGGQTIVGFEPLLDLTDSGLRRPKIVVCCGSDGTRFRQLVKGNDDIRQDAIMSQVFIHVNKLLNRSKGDEGRNAKDMKGTDPIGKLKKTKMKIATYNILPLSPRSGVSYEQSV
jgi:ataxia telangiectasia mutated family protein